MPIRKILMQQRLPIELSKKDIAWARQSARQSHQRWAEKAGHYPNKLGSHLLGKVGELAVGRFLQRHQIDFAPHFQHPEREKLSDLEANGVRIEVKTWRARYWDDLGRCIAVNQREQLEAKADVIVWCVVTVEEKTIQQIAIAGWSDLADIWGAPVRKTGKGTMRKVENYQLGSDNLRPLGKLIVRLRNTSKSS